MSDPPKLLDEGASEFERSLLGAWKDEKPSREAREKTLMAVGLAAGATAAGAVGGAAAGGTLAPKAAGLGGLALAKWIALGVAAAFGVSATVVATRSDHAGGTETSALSASPPSTTTAARSSLPDQAPAPAPPAPSSVTAPPDPEPLAVKPTTILKTHPVAAPHGSLGDEMKGIDLARTALENGDTAHTLALVRDYQRAYPNGIFAQEADVLRIEALVRRGDSSGANAYGARFLAAHPNSPHAAHVRALLKSAGPTAP